MGPALFSSHPAILPSAAFHCAAVWGDRNVLRGGAGKDYLKGLDSGGGGGSV